MGGSHLSLELFLPGGIGPGLEYSDMSRSFSRRVLSPALLASWALFRPNTSNILTVPLLFIIWDTCWPVMCSAGK